MSAIALYDEAPASFTDALTATFDYLGMHRGGHLHVNCSDGFSRSTCESALAGFVQRLRA